MLSGIAEDSIVVQETRHSAEAMLKSERTYLVENQ